jgi:hypothetical protein
MAHRNKIPIKGNVGYSTIIQIEYPHDYKHRDLSLSYVDQRKIEKAYISKSNYQPPTFECIDGRYYRIF